MTTAFEEFLSHINRRILLLETELKRLQDLRNGMSATNGIAPTAAAGNSAPKSQHRSTRKVA